MQIPSMTVIPELAHRLVSVSIAQGPLLTLNRTSTTLRGRHRLIQYQLTTTIVSPFEMWLDAIALVGLLLFASSVLTSVVLAMPLILWMVQNGMALVVVVLLLRFTIW